MTNEEARSNLEKLLQLYDDGMIDFSIIRESIKVAIKALMEQSKHDQNSMSKQPDLETLGIKTEETCEDIISRRDAIDAVKFGITYAKVLNKETGEVMELFKKSNEELQKAVDRIGALPSAKPNLQPTCNNLATDTISRQVAIDDMCKHFNYDVYDDLVYWNREHVLRVLKDLPSVQPEQHWIPVSERMPEPRIDVWCNSDMGQMVGYYEENVETWYGRDYLELMVTAWMPLPEPYSEDEE